MAAVTFELRGTPNWIRNLRKAGKGVARSAAAGVYELGNVIMADSQLRVPVDTGDLKASGFVAVPNVSGGTITSEVGYGGTADDYALVQHEDTTLRHPNGGEAKYLETSINLFSGNRGLRIMGEAVRKAFAAGGRGIAAAKFPTRPR